jgi:hypothetical protein
MKIIIAKINKHVKNTSPQPHINLSSVENLTILTRSVNPRSVQIFLPLFACHTNIGAALPL